MGYYNTLYNTFIHDSDDAFDRNGRRVTEAALFDAVELDDAAKVRFTTDGYLVASPRIARTGIQLYKGAECGKPELDVVRVYRSEDTVFNKDARRTYTHLPLTLEHPAGPVTPSTWKDVAVGETGDEVLRDGQSVRVPMMLRDASAIRAFKNGAKTQLSLGYTCDLEWTAGTSPAGEPYDARQSNIRCNHLALVANARGGSSLHIGDSQVESFSRRQMYDLEKAELGARWKGGLAEGDHVRMGDRMVTVQGRSPETGNLQFRDATTSTADARGEAYDSYDRDIQNSWMNTRDAAEAGGVCTTAGRESGTWRRRADGKLVCVPGKSTQEKEFELAGPLSDSERMQVKDRMYADYDSDVSERWRR